LMTMISCRAGWYLPAWAAISIMCMAWCTETNRNAYFDSGLQLNNVGRPSGSVADYLWPYHTVFVLCFAPTRFEVKEGLFRTLDGSPIHTLFCALVYP
jgi:hypothetical protein